MSAINKPNGKLFSFQYLFYDFVKITASIPGILWFRPKRLYENANAKKKIHGGALLISNHSGFVDPVHLMISVWYRRHHYVCGDDLMDSRAGWLLRLFQCIRIDKHDVRFSTMREIAAHLNEGELVSMFPEGHVNVTGGQLDAFKSGAVLLAVRSGKPIIPVYIKKRSRFFERQVTVIGERIDVRALYGERPTFAQLDEMARNLFETEKKLERIANGESA